MKTKEELNALKEEAKEHSRNAQALRDEELEKVAGGAIGHISCTNPGCKYYRSIFIVAAAATCDNCGAEMEWVAEGFYVPD